MCNPSRQDNNAEKSSSASSNLDFESSSKSDLNLSCSKQLWTMPSSMIDLMEVKEQLKTAVPCMCSLVLTKIPWFISLRFVGELGAKELAAAALATTLCNVTGMSLSVGVNSALTTLAGQARGELKAGKIQQQKNATISVATGSDTQDSSTEHQTNDRTPLINERNKDFIEIETSDYQSTSYSIESSSNPTQQHHEAEQKSNLSLPLMFLYRAIFIQFLILLPVGIWWLHGIQPLLLKLGQEVEICAMTEQYLRILVVALWSYSMNWTLTTWLQAIEMSDVPAYAAGVGLVLFIPFNHLFIYTLGYGYLGAAMATASYQLIQPIINATYLFVTPYGKRRVLSNAVFRQEDIMSTSTKTLENCRIPFWLEFRLAVTSLTGIKDYLSLALPGIIIISEWWASEISIFLSGTLTPNPEIALSGMSIYQSINAFMFMFPVSWSVAGSTRISNLLGSGNTKQAQTAAVVSVSCALLCSSSLGIMLYFIFPHDFFPSLFKPEDDVVAQTSKLIPLLSIYILGDGIQCALNGIIKGCGRQCIIMPIVVAAYWIVGLPLAYYFAFIKENGYMCDDKFFCGDVGLVAGMTVGTWLHMFLLLVVVVATTNWTLEAQKAKERLSRDKRKEPLRSTTNSTVEE